MLKVDENLAKNLEESNRHFREYITPVTSKVEFSTVTNDLILHAISDMKSSKAAVLDKISTKLLKESSKVIAPFLSEIFNLSLILAIFPDDWKHARA